MTNLSNLQVRGAASPIAVGVPMMRVANANIVQTAYGRAVSEQAAAGPELTTRPAAPGAYAGADGKSYFVPQAIVRCRNNNRQVPDVFFDMRDGKCTLSVALDLVRPDGVADDANVLLPDSLAVRLVATAAQPIVFSDVQVTPASGADPKVVQSLQCQTTVDVNSAPGIVRSDVGAFFDVTGQVHYRLKPPEGGGSPGGAPGGIRLGGIGSILRVSPMVAARSVATPVATAPTASPMRYASFRMIDVGRYSNPPTTPPPPPPPDVVAASVSLCDPQHRGNGAYFPTDNPHNRSIYVKVLDVGGDTSAVFAPTSNGYVEPSETPNEYYVLPDGFGLALDADTGLPAMSVLLVTTPAADAGGAPSYTVRTRFTVAPWMDASRLSALRSSLRQTDEVAYADLRIGGYAKATFSPSHLFDGLGQNIVGGNASAAIDVDAANGFELVMDCSLELYTLLSKLLVSGDGLQGHVAMQIPTAANPAFEVDVPVKLTLTNPAASTFHVALDPGSNTGSDHPCILSINNSASAQASAAQIFATLLLMDQNMPYPASATTVDSQPATIDIPAGGHATVVLTAKPDATDAGDVSLRLGPLHIGIDPTSGDIDVPKTTLPPWSAVAVDFGSVKLRFDPAAVLAKIHERAGASGLASTVHVRCFALAHVDQLPESLGKRLAGIHVQVQRGTDKAIDAYLTVDGPQQEVQLALSLSDLVAGVSPTEPTFQWRQANMYAGSTGPWSDWTQNTGTQLFVVPSDN